MKHPEITSFVNGILEWKDIDEATELCVDGRTISDNADGLYHGNSIDLKKYGAVRVELSFPSSRKKLELIADASKRTVRLAPVACEFDSETGELYWDAACGALAYRAVDVDYGVVRVRGTRLDLSARKYIIGVLPISDSDVVADGAPCDLDTARGINYLDGRGTVADPYRIRTAYDLRAVDYYEAMYAQALGRGEARAVNNYRIENDINYGAVAAGDEESNIVALNKPFYGVLDGNGKKLINIRVRYDHGYFALFDFIVRGAEVKNIRFVRPEIINAVKSASHPIAAEVAAVANRNHGAISGITLKNATFSASGGEVCGICSHNYGTVRECSVSGTFVQENTGLVAQACYEMSGVVLENRDGGVVENCSAVSVVVRGTNSTGGYGSAYYNVRTAAGIVAVNRKGGIVEGNDYAEVTMTNINPGFEYGGIVAYNAGRIKTGSARLGKFKFQGATVVHANGTGAGLVGTVVGKNDGTVE